MPTMMLNYNIQRGLRKAKSICDLEFNLPDSFQLWPKRLVLEFFTDQATNKYLNVYRQR
jgi:hypothetical protein